MKNNMKKQQSSSQSLSNLLFNSLANGSPSASHVLGSPLSKHTQKNTINKIYSHNKKNSKQSVNTALSPPFYHHLHQKLNFIQNKIIQMKSKLENKIVKKNTLKSNSQHYPNSGQQLGQQQKTINKSVEDKLNNLVTRVPQHKSLECFEFDPYSPRHNIYYISQIIKGYKIPNSITRQHLINSLNIFRILQHSRIPSIQQISNKMVYLKKSKNYENAKTIIFDLDETLIHCNESLSAPYDVKLPITFPTGQVVEAGINIRPNAIKILQTLSQRFEIIIFTASHECYANVVIDYLDPQKKYVHHRLFRQSCHQSKQNIYIKDLRVINRNLQNIVLVDNAAYSYAYQIDNGIPILPYYRGQNDYELKELEKYLLSLIMVDDVRKVNRQTFKFMQYNQYYNNPNKLVEQLYIGCQ